MPRYFFDVHDGISVKDDVGRALPDLKAVRLAAMQIAATFAAKPAMLGDNGGAIYVVVRDLNNNVVLDVRLLVHGASSAPAQLSEGRLIARGQFPLIAVESAER